MISIKNSDTLIEVSNLKVHFEMEHYRQPDVRDLFVSMVTHPLDFFFKQKEIFYAIDDVSFSVKRGMRLGILGVNGSGKTTLCRCIAGMIRAQRGTIKSDVEIKAIFDTGSGVMPELTGRENAMLLARFFFPKEKDILPLVEEALIFSELGHFVDIPFKQYSKGMQSRLVLSLISAKSTDVIILDEVFDGADIFFQAKLSLRMRKLIEQAGATIFVSHSIDQIRQVCNQVMILNAGKVHFIGDIEEGYNTYLKLNEKGP
jgi:ABC-type polysaccharide/polyol phosphate transport system ATPase subunit